MNRHAAIASLLLAGIYVACMSTEQAPQSGGGGGARYTGTYTSTISGAGYGTWTGGSTATVTGPGTAATTGGRNEEIGISWDAPGGAVDTYRIYVSRSPGGAADVLSEVDAASQGPGRPTVTFTTGASGLLKSLMGGQVCLTVKAVAGGVESDASNQECVNI